MNLFVNTDHDLIFDPDHIDAGKFRSLLHRTNNQVAISNFEKTYDSRINKNINTNELYIKSYQNKFRVTKSGKFTLGNIDTSIMRIRDSNGDVTSEEEIKVFRRDLNYDPTYYSQNLKSRIII